MQRKAIVELIVIRQILPNAVHNQMQQLMIFVQEQRDRQVPYLFLRVLVRGYQVHSLKVSKVDIPPQDVDV